MQIDFAGNRLILLPQRGAYWPEGRGLFVADLHLGKAEAFTIAGRPVPTAVNAVALHRLDAMLSAHPVEHLYLLGDLLHAPASHGREVLDALRAFRERHAGIEMLLIRGNHDRRAGDPPREVGITCIDEPLGCDPFILAHDAECIGEGASGVIAGHVHPVVTLRDRDGTSIRRPCFVVCDPARLILPAVGGFTGGARATTRGDCSARRQREGVRFFLVDDDAVVEAPNPCSV